MSLALYSQLEAVNLDSLGLQLPSFWDRQHPQYFSPLPPEGPFQPSGELGPARECGWGSLQPGVGRISGYNRVSPWEIPAREGSQQRQQQSGEDSTPCIPPSLASQSCGHTQAQCLSLLSCQHFHVFALPCMVSARTRKSMPGHLG